jgi:hypothetical protein
VGKPILCLDFDGVLHSYTSGWQGVDEVSDAPVEGALEFLWDASQHFRICVVSSRSHEESGRKAMENALYRWLLDTYGEDASDLLMRRIEFPEHKPPALVTLDDRGITFDGTFPNPKDLLAFRPWNKKEGP